MSKSVMLLSSGLAFLFLVPSGLAKNFTSPNIIIILADDMGFDDVSFRGGREFLTPNIDALAYHGKILNRHYTPPMCSPSRTALLTGLYPIHTGAQHFLLFNEEPWSLLEGHQNMAKILQQNGYSTNLIGKWHLGLGSRNFTPTYQGFDYHYGYWGGYADYYSHSARMEINSSLGYDFRRNLDIVCPDPHAYATDLFTKEAEGIILENAGSKPLFLFVSHMAPHAENNDEPLKAPAEEIEKFSHIPDRKRRTYAAMVSKFDESIGKIVKALANANMLNNSIILFYSDNGAPSMGSFNNTGSNWPLKGQKNTPWEGGVRVPAAIWSPLLRNRGSIYQQPLYAGDWLPTLAAAAKIDLNLTLDGLNMWYELKSSTTQPHDGQREILHVLDEMTNFTSYMKGKYKYIIGTTFNGQYDGVLRHRNLKVIDPRDESYAKVILSSLTSQVLHSYDEAPLTPAKIQLLRSQLGIKCGSQASSCGSLKEECLFNIWLDPCEQNNLAHQPKFAKLLKQMRARVEWLRKDAVKPKIGGSLAEYDPSRHNCMWTNYLEEPPTEYTLKCDYNSPTPLCQDNIEC
uniref:Sulfatase N-terminal domain-containing protein n=1 Tax=Stomoxys calcitrans TaxID=35570 RepID=A0A1I8PCR6_STOCA